MHDGERDELIGRVDLIDVENAVDHWKAQGLDLSAILYRPEVDASVATHAVTTQNHGLDAALDLLACGLAGAHDAEADPGFALPLNTLCTYRWRKVLMGVGTPCRRPSSTISPVR